MEFTVAVLGYILAAVIFILGRIDDQSWRAKVDRFERLLRQTRNALDPFRRRVFDSNGDLVVEMSPRLNASELVDLYFLHKKIEGVLEDLEE